MARRLVAAIAFAILSTSDACAEPISAAIVSSIFAALEISTTATIAGTTITYAAVATAIVTTALGLGLTLLFMPRPKTPPSEAGQIALQQSMPYRFYGYGEMAHSGALMYKEEASAYLVHVAALIGHRIDSFVGLYLHDDKVTVPIIDGMLNGPVARPNPNDLRYVSSVIKINTRLGKDLETYYTEIADLVPANWTVSHRGDTTASLAMVCTPVEQKQFSKVYPYAAPNPRAIMRLAICYDWRDPTQLIGNPQTWKWTRNTILQIAHWLCFSPYGFHEDYSIRILPNLAQWTQAADDCDDFVPTAAGGTERRYESHGIGSTESSAAATLVTLLQSCDALLLKAGGYFRIFVGKYRESDVVILDDDIKSIHFQNGQITENAVNETISKYTFPDTGYTSVDTDPYIDLDDQSIRPGPPRKATLDIGWVHSPGQASRLRNSEAKRQKEPLRGRMTLHWSGMNACFERWPRISSNSPRLAGVVIENMKPIISARGLTIEIDFIGSGPQIDDYNASTDETTHPTVTQRPESTALPIPSDINVIAATYFAEDLSEVIALDISFVEPKLHGGQWPGLSYSVRYRIVSNTVDFNDWVTETITETFSIPDRVYIQISGVPIALLEVEVASVAGSGVLSAYSQTVETSTLAGVLAPLSPQWASAVVSPGSVTFTVYTPNSFNVAFVQFYRGVTGTTFADASPIGSPVACIPSSTADYTDTRPAGQYDYFAVSLTVGSIGSAPSPVQHVTIT